MFMGLQIVNAQSKQISGTVTSAEDGLSMPGVSVVIKGTTIGASTDIDGKYSLEASSEDVLMFSFVGMITQEITVGNKTVINVVLETESIGMDEVVVTALGVTREKKALGYAVQEVGGDEIVKSNNVNLVNSIGGKVAGVQVNSSSGVAGGSSFITIRGMASLTGNNQPLFVVDGVPIDNSMNYSGNPDDGRNNLTDGVAYSNRAIDLNPDDIASMSILKGGAATALYGLRAANGVVLVTTKSGKKTAGRKVDVTFSSTVSIDKISQMPDMQYKYAQGLGGDYTGADGPWWKMFSWGPEVSSLEYDGDTNYKWDPRGRLVPKGTGNGMPAQTFDKEDFFETGVTYNNSVGVSGGSEFASFYLSAAYNKSNGVVPENEYEKKTFTLSSDFKISDKLTLGAKANYIHSGGTRIQQGSNLSGVMLGLLRTATTFDNAAGYEFEDGTQRNYRGGAGYDNPYWTANKSQLKDKVDRLIGNLNLKYEFNSNLTLSYRLGIDTYTDKRKSNFAINSRANTEGQVQEDEHFQRDINSDLILSFNKSLSDKVNFTALVGQNMFSSYYQQVYIQGDQLGGANFYHVSNAANHLVRERVEEKRTAAWYGDLGLDWNNMVYFRVTGRQEWSTTLPESENSFFYPSTSLGIVLSEIPALKDMTWLNFAKLRTSYAVIANDAPVYSTFTTYDQTAYGDGSTSGISFPFNGQIGYAVGDVLGNEKLKPEKMKSFEIGLELSLFQNRLSIDAAYYNNQNEDLILSVPLSGTSGYISRIMNAGEMENKGIELLISGTPVKTNDFSWDMIVNFTKNENEVLSLAEGVENVGLGGFTGSNMRAVKGKPYGSVYGSDWVRNDAGRIVVDANGMPSLSQIEVELGSAQPDWTMGITNSFTYKGFTLSSLIDIKKGGIMWNGTRGVLQYFGTHGVTENRGEEYVFDAVTADGAENTTAITLDQDWYTGLGNGWDGPSSQFIEDAGWVRLKEVSLSYEFPKSIIGDSFIKSLSLSFTGKNLWIDTDYTGVDPETSLMGANNAQGLDYFNMPGTKSYIFGLRMSF
jgi:TonB-linked SusC/RagA family outer membrane protein